MMRVNSFKSFDRFFCPVPFYIFTMSVSERAVSRVYEVVSLPTDYSNGKCSADYCFDGDLLRNTRFVE